MSVAPTSAAAALASTAAASERASKVQVNTKESDQARRSRHGKPAGDRVVLSPEAVQPKQSVTERSEGRPGQDPQMEDRASHIDVEG
ncbi:MAG: hypothetical protein RIB58_13560 [Phycisphaerales bacterium]